MMNHYQLLLCEAKAKKITCVATNPTDPSFLCLA